MEIKSNEKLFILSSGGTNNGGDGRGLDWGGWVRFCGKENACTQGRFTGNMGDFGVVEEGCPNG